MTARWPWYSIKPGMGNLLSRQRLELFAATYAGSVVAPNSMGAGTVPERGHFMAQQQQCIARLLEQGMLRAE